MSTTQLFAAPNQNLISIFDMDNLIPAQVEQLIPKMNPAFQRPVISKLIDNMGIGAVQNVGNVIFNVYRQPNDFPSSSIQSQSLAGGNLTLTLSGDSINALQPDMLVQGSSGCVATVISNNGNGQVVLKFFSNPNGNTAFDSAADFLAGQIASYRGTLGNQQNRQVSNMPFVLPTQFQNYVSQWDAKTTVTFNDAHTKTYVSTPAGNFYALQKEVQTMGFMMQGYSAYMLNDMPKVANSNRPMGASIVNQIKTMGGLSVPLSSPLTIQAFRDAARLYKASGGFITDEVVVTCGSQYLGDIQEDMASYVLTSGTNNVVGGSEVLGLNITTYGFEGLKFKFIVDPFLDNKRIFGIDPATGFSRRSRSAIWMATERVQTENGGTLPFVVDYYFGSTSDIARQEVVGMTNSRGEYVKQGANGQKAAEVNFSVNKTTQLMNPSGCLTHGI